MSRCSRSISRSASPRMRAASSGLSSTSDVARSSCRRSAVSGVRSWCEASPAKRSLLLDEAGEPVGHRVERRRQRAQLGRALGVVGRASKSPPATRSVLVRSRRSGPVTDPAMNRAATAAASSEMPATTSRPRTRRLARPSISESSVDTITAPTVAGAGEHRHGDRDDVAVAPGRRLALQGGRHLRPRRRGRRRRRFPAAPATGDDRAGSIGDDDAAVVVVGVVGDRVGQRDIRIVRRRLAGCRRASAEAAWPARMKASRSSSASWRSTSTRRRWETSGRSWAASITTITPRKAASSRHLTGGGLEPEPDAAHRLDPAVVAELACAGRRRGRRRSWSGRTS